MKYCTRVSTRDSCLIHSVCTVAFEACLAAWIYMAAPCLAAIQTLLMGDRIYTDRTTAPSCLCGCLLVCVGLVCMAAGVLKG